MSLGKTAQPGNIYVPDAKRQRLSNGQIDSSATDGGGGGGETGSEAVSSRLVPSLVVFVRNLGESADKALIKQSLETYGLINDLVVLTEKRQALVEFAHISSAIRCVGEAKRQRVVIGDSLISATYSHSQQLNKKKAPVDNSIPADPNPILFFTIANAIYPITVDVMYTICSPFAKILRIVVFRNRAVQAMVEFETLEGAKHAKEYLNNAEIYTDCCKLGVSYAKTSKLRVKKNDQDSWDYTIESYEDKVARELSKAAVESHLMSIYPTNSHSSITSSTFIVSNLCPEKFNCDRLFNFFCLYGNILKIEFFMAKGGQAMLQMSNGDEIFSLLPSLNNTYMFGRRLQLCVAKPDMLSMMTNRPTVLYDGSPAFKDYSTSKRNRYNHLQAALKNRPIAPANVLHWYNAPPDINEQALNEIFLTTGCKPPIKIKLFPRKPGSATSTGLAEWSNIGDCAEALVLANHYVINNPSSPFTFKLCFSQTPIVDEH